MPTICSECRRQHRTGECLRHYQFKDLEFIDSAMTRYRYHDTRTNEVKEESLEDE